MFLGLRTVVYPTRDLAASKAWWSQVLGIKPYFDEEFYVGFNPGGYELGLAPAEDTSADPRTYWGVRDIEAAAKRMIAAGAVTDETVTDVGDGIRLGTWRSPQGDIVGLIENPAFKLAPVPGGDGEGPGR
jgi:catechol 2,3-dioxygenase-like lactoylglutathione lyase family enzyme